MHSLFKLFSQSCGLPLKEVCSFLGTNPETTKSWWMGRRTPPETVLEKLADLCVRQDIAAQELLLILETLGDRADNRITLKVCASDPEAQQLGWPSLNAYRAIIRRTVEKIPPKHAMRLVLVTDSQDVS